LKEPSPPLNGSLEKEYEQRLGKGCFVNYG